jgi:leader peptidase (prepilin peptidase)/N-methyltransferase
MFYASIIIFGLVIGSFLNVVILRHEKEEGLNGRSYCPLCRKILCWYELVPFFSYIAQRGRCRGCGAHISVQYPLVEVLTGVLFAIVLYVSHQSIPAFSISNIQYPISNLTYLKIILDLVIWSVLIVIMVYDLRTKLIPNRFSYSFAVLALASSSLTVYTSFFQTGNLQPLISTLLAGPLLFLPFYLLWWYSDGKWIGLGDGKLALGIGWYLGLSHGATAIMLAFWIGAAVSLTLIGYQKILARFSNLQPGASNLSLSSEVPFGPFLILGTLIVYFCSLNLFTLV